jgi:uncharacterized membrane protein YhiD involved in acid resistance
MVTVVAARAASDRVIIKQGSSVTGLNTAATLWATAAVGALAGAV